MSSLVFPILLFSSFFALVTEEGFLISLCYSWELCIKMDIAFLFSLTHNINCHNSENWLKEMEIKGPWIWRLTVPKTTKTTLVRDYWWPLWRWLSELTVQFLHIAPTSVYKSSCPTGCQWVLVGGKSAFGPTSNLHHDPQLPASEIKRTFLFTNLACHWILSS